MSKISSRAALPADQAYADFLAKKAVTDPSTGLIGKDFTLPDAMFPFQRDVASWALRRGRGALFAGTGLGKTLMELAWGQEIERETKRPILHFAPLAVSAQIVREAQKFGVPARLVTSSLECEPGTICVTNYQKMQHFDIGDFGATILDESSILKSTDGHYRTELVDRCSVVPFRLAATATPAPNDFMELGNHAEFLGVMSYTDMLATFFVHDGGDTQKWRLKGHAEDEFWKWMASWAVMLRKPSDLGYDDTGYDLPPLIYQSHVVDRPHDPSETGTLFAMEAQSLSERITARRVSVDDRIEKAVSIVTADFWAITADEIEDADICQDGKRNTRTTDAQKLLTIRNMLQNLKQPDPALPKKTGNTCEPIMPPTSTNGEGEPQSNNPNTMQPGEKNTPQIPSLPSASVTSPTLDAPRKSAKKKCAPRLGSGLSSTNKFSPTKGAAAPFVASGTASSADSASQSIIATKPDQSEAFSAQTAIVESECLATAGIGLTEPSNTSTPLKLDRWVIWCHLNSEQDALEKAFGDLCFSARGSNTDDQNERAIGAWLDGDRPVLLGKPSMLGFGLNLQCCHNCIFVGLNDSFEQFYQAVRRFWRFGQTQPVNCHIISAATEGAVVANIRRKEADADRMAAAMIEHMADLSSQAVRGSVRDNPVYNPKTPMAMPSFLSEGN